MEVTAYHLIYVDHGDINNLMVAIIDIIIFHNFSESEERLIPMMELN